ncbi:hypothetical protein JCM18237_23630 [Halorubrum luteum]
MIRVVLVVLVSVALLATALPALNDARTTTTVDRLETEGERLDRAIGSLDAESVAIDDPSLAARTTVTLRAPTGITAARIDRLALGDPERIIDVDRTVHDRSTIGRTTTAETGRSGDRSLPNVAIVYVLSDGSPRLIPVTSAGSTTSIRVVDGPIELRTGGSSRLELRLVDTHGTGTVRVARVR